MMEKVRIVPTWEAATQIYVMALENGTGAGQNAARDELLRLGRQYDEAVDVITRAAAVMTEVLAAWDMEQDTPEHNQRDRLAGAIEAVRELLREDCDHDFEPVDGDNSDTATTFKCNNCSVEAVKGDIAA